MPKLTASKPERLFSSAKPSKKDYKVYDQNGLYLLVRSSGVTVWQVSYTFKSKRNTFTIGNFGRAVGCCSLAQARMKALEVKAMAKSGIDPNQEKNSLLQEEMVLTGSCFETIAREWHSKGTWVKKHAANILRSLESDVFPDLGEKLVTDIKKKDIITLLDKVEARGALDVAKRIKARCDMKVLSIKNLSHNEEQRKFNLLVRRSPETAPRHKFLDKWWHLNICKCPVDPEMYKLMLVAFCEIAEYREK